MLVIDRKTAYQALPIPDAIPRLAEAMRLFSEGAVTQPLRTIVRPAGETAVLGAMPCHIATASGGFGLKAVVYRPDNAARGLHTHQGVVVVFDPDTGQPAALVDAAAVTAIRTPAVSAAATAALARPDAGDLAILGSGVQARGHLAAMAAVRDLRRVRVWSRTAAHARRFSQWAADELGIEVTPSPSVAEALDGADVVCTALATEQPVIEAEHLAPGAHINAVGASFPHCRELTSAAVARCTVFADSRESARHEAGDLIAPLNEGLIGPNHVAAELGEVLLGQHPGRRDPEEITLFKSLGLAVQDVTAGFAIAAAAQRAGLGVRIDVD